MEEASSAQATAMEQDYDEIDLLGEEEEDNRRRWEKDYERTWDVLEEDETGTLKTAVIERQRKERRRKIGKEGEGAVRRGMHRHLFLIVDFSKAMEDTTEMRPSRLSVTLRVAEAFIMEYFDQNPIAHLGIIVTRNSIAEKLTELGGNPNRHITALKSNVSTGGEASIQNALEVARASLCHIPKWGSREILIIFGGLSTCDPGDIFQTITRLKQENIRASVVALAAELHVCKALAQTTGGTHSVAMHQEHFRELMYSHTPPPPTTTKTEASLVRMGFPKRRTDEFPSLCICHQVLKQGGYFCPQCKAKFCELPTDCQICNLTLVSSPHLARSYHHLFPVPAFKPYEIGELMKESLQCFACKKWIAPETNSLYSCPRCSHHFCYDCDIFIHESLHNCPGCETGSDTKQQ